MWNAVPTTGVLQLTMDPATGGRRSIFMNQVPAPTGRRRRCVGMCVGGPSGSAVGGLSGVVTDHGCAGLPEVSGTHIGPVGAVAPLHPRAPFPPAPRCRREGAQDP